MSGGEAPFENSHFVLSPHCVRERLRKSRLHTNVVHDAAFAGLSLPSLREVHLYWSKVRGELKALFRAAPNLEELSLSRRAGRMRRPSRLCRGRCARCCWTPVR